MKRESWLLSILVAISFGLFYFLRTPFGGDWDSYDFIWQVVVHRHSNLGFGRLYFIAYNIPIWEAAVRLFNVARIDAYKVIQLATICLGSAALIPYYFTLKRLVNGQVAWLGTVLLMTSPFYVVYAGFVMTEIPMIFFLMWALFFHLKGIEEGRLGCIALGSALFGFTIGVRENAMVFAPLFVALPFIRSRNRSGHGWKVLALTILPAFIVAMAGPLWIAWHYPIDYPIYVKYWLSKVPRTRTLEWTLLGFLVMYMFLNSPISTVLLPPALIELIRRWRSQARAANQAGEKAPLRDPSTVVQPAYNASHRELLMIGALLIGVPYAALLMNSDMKYYARYVLIGVPGLAMLAGLYIHDSAARLQAGRLWKYTLTLGLSGVVLLIGTAEIRHRNQREQRRKDIVEHLYNTAPEDAVFLPGRLTPVIEGYRQMGLRPQWEMISSGWPWPGRENLAHMISEVIQAERPLYLISDSSVWYFLEQEQSDINCIRDQFHFEKVGDYLEIIQPKAVRDLGSEVSSQNESDAQIPEPKAQSVRPDPAP